MTIDFQTWMRSVWDSIMEPSAAAERVIAARLDGQTLWTGVALVTVLNVLLVALLQFLSQVPAGMAGATSGLTPFSYAAIIGIFLGCLVFALHLAGAALGGAGTQIATLAIIVWFQAISLTLEAVQIAILLISPALASLFGMLSLGALLWCLINFINVLHQFDHLGKATVTLILALLGAALTAGIMLALFGITPAGGLT